jgi:dihydrofolate reductase
MELTIIAAYAKNSRAIGYQGSIPWNIPEDLRRFKDLTTGHPVIMGRTTYESIIARNGKPLPQRTNVVVSSKQKVARGIVVCRSLEAALRYVKDKEVVYAIGGQRIYEATLPLATTLELTEVDQDVKGDAFFPEFNREEWEVTKEDQREHYNFITYGRKE